MELPAGRLDKSAPDNAIARVVPQFAAEDSVGIGSNREGLLLFLVRSDSGPYQSTSGLNQLVHLAALALPH
jgi:hypothetical protein